MDLCVSLVKNMSVVMVLAYLLVRSRSYNELLNRHVTWRNQLFLILGFGIVSIYGSWGGLEILGGTANLRDLGPAIAGLAGGPVAGLGAGLIGAMYRYSSGGITALPGSLSAISAGLVGGIIYRVRKGRMVSVLGAVIFAGLLESFQIGLILALSYPHEQALAIVQETSLPMIFSNALALGLFVFIVNKLLEQQVVCEKNLMSRCLMETRDYLYRIFHNSPIPDRHEIHLQDVLEPAGEIGGSFYEYFLLEEDLLCLIIGNVSGQGIPALIHMAEVKTLIRAHAHASVKPDEILGKVNEELWRDHDTPILATAFLAVLRISSGDLFYCSAGHRLPNLVRQTGSVEQLPDTPGMVLGASGEDGYENRRVKLGQDDTLILCSDGMTRSRNRQGEILGEDGLERVLLKLSGVSLQGQVRMIMDSVKDFIGGARIYEDLGILALKYELNTEMKEIRIKNRLSEIERLAGIVEEYGERNSIPDRTMFGVNLSLDELLVNTIRYGYEDDQEHFIYIRMELREGEIQIEIRDDGRPFNPLEGVAYDLGEGQEQRAGGLGIHLVRNMMDLLEYKRETDTNVLLMKKKIVSE